MLVTSLKSDETLYSLNPHKLLMPASNMKIVTLAAAASRLGWDYTYETKLLATGSIANGTLAGDLIVVGSGDPSIRIADGTADRAFTSWADRLKELGIRAIAGRIVGDAGAFEKTTLGFGWSWDDLPDDYAAGVGALQFNESAVRVTVAAGPAAGDAAAISVEPPGCGVEVASTATTGAIGSAASLTTTRLPGHQRLEIGGTIPAGGAASILTVSVDNPTLFFVQALRLALIARGIDVRGAAVDADDLIDRPASSSARLLLSHRSPPLSTLAMRLMKASQNQYAETFLKTLSLARSPAPRGGSEHVPAAGASPGETAASRSAAATSAGGRASVRSVLAGWGIADAELIQRDGSGLSRYDYVTADALVKILMNVYRDDTLRGPFEASLPIAGRDGSLRNRLKGTPAEDNARAKTGSMSNVRALSGYVTTAGGEPLAFAILANSFEVGADVINRATDAIVVRLAELRR